MVIVVVVVALKCVMLVVLWHYQYRASAILYEVVCFFEEY